MPLLLRQQRAFSTLIITVLLIGLTVILVGLLIGWSQRFTFSLTQEADRTSLELQGCVTSLAYQIRSSCFDPSAHTLRFQVENIGTIPVQGFLLRVFFRDAEPRVVPSSQVQGLLPLPITAIETYTAPFSPGATPERLEIIPLIQLQRENITCVEQGVAEDILPCS